MNYKEKIPNFSIYNEKRSNFIARRVNNDLTIQKALSFDCEWCVVDRERQPISIIQIASATGYCVIFKVKFGVPDILRKWLEDENILKYGVGITHDAQLLFKDFQVSMVHVQELTDGSVPRKSLQKLAKEYLQEDIDKTMQRSNWSKRYLSDVQLRYARQDVIIGLKLFNVLSAMFYGYAINNKIHLI